MTKKDKEKSKQKIKEIATSGFTLDYVDPNSGLEIPGAWAEVRYISYTPNFNCAVICDIYKNEQAFIDKAAAIFQNVAPQVLYGDDNWNAYFDTSVMNQPNCNILAMALEYLQAVI